MFLLENLSEQNLAFLFIMMSQNFIIFLWSNLILDKMYRIRQQASFVFKLYYQTHTLDIVELIIRKHAPMIDN